MKKIIIVSSLMVLCMHQAVMAKVPTLPFSWTGIYNDEQKIALFFKQDGSVITGYSILNGKQMPFLGSVPENGQIVLKEQAKGASAGVFEFQYKKSSIEMGGSWKSSSAAVRPKFFTVQAQKCRYAKSEGDFDGSERLFKDADLQVPLGQLQYMRNEIYARHGYAFTNKEWSRTFAHTDWYMPCYTNVEKRLTTIEKENIRRIKLVEPYAKDIDWGR